jgi:glycerol-3-phosphate cytidylyltransferase
MKLSYKECGVIGFTCSTFDLLHAGHITMLEEAKRNCDYLIVGLQNDPSADRPEKNGPVQSLVERQIQLAAVKYIDEIVIYNTEQDLRDLLLCLPIDVRVLGDEYEDKDFTGREIAEQRGSKIIYNGRDHSFSSSSLRKRVVKADSIFLKGSDE